VLLSSVQPPRRLLKMALARPLLGCEGCGRGGGIAVPYFPDKDMRLNELCRELKLAQAADRDRNAKTTEWAGTL
jgi:hypothetical protein